MQRAALAFSLVAFLAPAASAQGPVTMQERAAAIASLELAPGGEGQVMNDCGEAVTPDVHAAELGGEVGRALLVVIKGGPNTAGCYGMTGMQFFLLRKTADRLTLILSDFGHVAILETAHNGVKDIAVGGPGFEFPVYEWNGTDYVQGRTIPDTEFPQALN